MRRWSWSVAMVLVMVPTIVFAVNDIRFGTTEAYWYPGGYVRVPVLMTNDVPIMSWGIAFRVSSGSLVIDSVTGSGRVTSPDQAVIMVVANEHCTNSPDGTPIDSGYLIGALRSEFAVAAGSGEVCSIWLHGYSVGSQLSFALPPALQPDAPGGCVEGQITKFISKSFEDVYPVPLSSSLTVAEALLEISGPSIVQGKTLQQLSISMDVTSFFGEANLEIVSFEGPSGATPFPTLTGSGPWQITWTPSSYGAGAYLLTVRASNGHGQSTQKAIAISILPSVLSGDTDCNGVVDLTDLSRLINFLVNRSGAPFCP